MPLFAEDFLYVTDLLLHFASDLFVGAAISQVRIADCFPGFLFGFAFGFAQSAFDLIFCARSHTSDSLRAACPSGYFGEREITHAFGSGQKGPSHIGGDRAPRLQQSAPRNTGESRGKKRLAFRNSRSARPVPSDQR